MAPHRRRHDEGAAVVDFVLVAMVLVPMFLAIVQVALVMYVRTTLAAAATEGARYAATIDRGPADGVAVTRRQIAGALAGTYAREVTSAAALVEGVPGVTVHVHAVVPPLGLWGPGISLDATGHAVKEVAR